MSAVIVSVATTPTAPPSGILAGLLRVALTDASGTVAATQDVTGAVATFENVSPGTYTASAVRLDSNGNALGGTITGAAVVPEPATYDAPSSLTVTLAA